MKKLFLLLLTSVILFFYANSQISYSVIQETVQYDSKSAAVSVVHSSGFIYHFQSSNSSIYVTKLNAATLTNINQDYRLDNVGANYTLNGGFEDPEGNIIIYGSSSTNGFIYKIQIPSLTILNVANIPNNKITNGCWGEKNSNGVLYDRAYGFLSHTGKIFISNSNLIFNTNQYSIDNGYATFISWDIVSRKFLCSGYKVSQLSRVNPDPFLIRCDFKDSYSTGWLVYNQFFLSEGTYLKGLYGKIVHAVLNDGRVLIAQAFKISGIPWVLVSLHTLSNSSPYTSTVDAISKIDYSLGEFKILDILKTPNSNIFNLLLSKKDVNNISKNVLSTISVNQNIINHSNVMLDADNIILTNITYNQFDELRPLCTFSGLFRGTDQISRAGVLVSEHETFNSNCDLPCVGTPYMSTSYSTSPLVITNSTMPTYLNINIPLINISNIHGIKGVCGEYHTGLPDKSLEKSINTKNEINITLLESQEFILQGFTGSVQCNIYDMTGKMAYSVSAENDMNNSIPALSSGIYILKAVDNHGNNKTIKFFKD